MVNLQKMLNSKHNKEKTCKTVMQKEKLNSLQCKQYTLILKKNQNKPCSDLIEHNK